MSGQLLYDPEFRMPDFKRPNTIKEKEGFRSEYAKQNTEAKKLKYLGYRDDIMCRQIVNNKVTKQTSY